MSVQGRVTAAANARGAPAPLPRRLGARAPATAAARGAERPGAETSRACGRGGGKGREGRGECVLPSTPPPPKVEGPARAREEKGEPRLLRWRDAGGRGRGAGRQERGEEELTFSSGLASNKTPTKGSVGRSGECAFGCTPQSTDQCGPVALGERQWGAGRRGRVRHTTRRGAPPPRS